jgi:hypothetical protein
MVAEPFITGQSHGRRLAEGSKQKNKIIVRERRHCAKSTLVEACVSVPFTLVSFCGRCC